MDKIASTIIQILKQHKNRSVGKAELASYLKGYKPSRLKKVLKELALADEEIICFGKSFTLREHLVAIEGSFIAHPDGYGFASTEREKDIFIPHNHINNAIHGDDIKILFVDANPGEKTEGIIEKVIKRNKTDFVGRLTGKGEKSYVIPTDTRINYNFNVTSKDCNNAKNKDLVKVKITSYPSDDAPPQAVVTEVLGETIDSRIDTRLIIEEFGLPLEFPEELLNDLKKLTGKITKAEAKKRTDLRELVTVTIDGETAKDFDDAVSIEKDGDNYKVWVHIADVSHFVKPGTLLESEALERGTSVYFPDMVLPMLPEKLSNNLCSLTPKTDKLTLTVEILFSPFGKKLSYKIYKSIINSNERMTYNNVKEILDKSNEKLLKQYAEYIDMFNLMKALCEKLQKARSRRGSIDFDLPEPLIILDVTGKIVDVVNEERNIAHMIIEEFMIAANNTVTEFAEEHELPFLHRVHEAPKLEKINDLHEFLKKFSITFKKKKNVQPKHMQEILKQAKGMVFERMVNHVILRCMTQAFYSPENKGHFGLALENYAHFTSPIRRFPDLINHRMIKKYLTIKEKFTLEGIETIAKLTSKKERIAMEAERKSIDTKKVRYMEDKVGEKFSGFISGVTSFGIFVELEEIFIEGLISLASIEDDYYNFIEKDHAIVGKTNGTQFMVGDRVDVQVKCVNLHKRQIDFKLILPKSKKKRKSNGRKRKTKKRSR